MTQIDATIKPRHVEVAEIVTSALVTKTWGSKIKCCRECKASAVSLEPSGLRICYEKGKSTHTASCPVTKVAQAVSNTEQCTIERAAEAANKIGRECDRPGGDFACNTPSATAAYECEKAIRALLET